MKRLRERQPPVPKRLREGQTADMAGKTATKGKNFNLIRESLIKELRSILDQYPDDGQILKEFLQNAEDAGARHVKFLYDQNSYGTRHLHHPELAKHQGAALYAYNDALFDEKDWMGIRMLNDSIKEKDPMKVGRFGLGFKSVLHITDLPGVLSDRYCAVIDPHEKYFTHDGDRATGQRWHLIEDREELRQIPDQLAPYHNVFGCTEQMLRDGYFEGTIFRFPLRQEASRLSPTIYDHDRMEALFKSFETDAHMTLIFLKQLESVELSVRASGEQKPVTTFVVRIAPSCLENVKKKRKEFSQAVQSYQRQGNVPKVSMTYTVSIETLKYGEPGQPPTSQLFYYLVNEYYTGNEGSPELQMLRADPELKSEPLVGVALPLVKDSQPNASADAEEDEEEKVGGNVFCFLPLPVEQKSSSGLPVHVNGYFRISQNRRHLKWPSAGQKKNSDKAVHWNQCLLSEVLPKSYAELLLVAMEMSKQRSQIFTADRIYNSFPDLTKVNEKWMPLLPELFDTLFKHNVFYTAAEGGKWIPVQECYFDCLREDTKTKKVVLDVLLAGKVPVVCVPKHILHALGAFSTHSPNDVNPALMRTTLKSQPQLHSSLNREGNLSLLSYVLKDSDFRELKGIQLLPLADGTFATFHLRSPAVYIPNDSCPRILLPGLEASLLSDQTSDRLQGTLTDLAKSGCTQLREAKKADFPGLVAKVIPQEWQAQETVTMDQGVGPLSEWIEVLWKFLVQAYAMDLRLFEGLTILPMRETEPIKLMKLCSLDTTTVLLKSSPAFGMELEDELCSLLKKMGLHIVDSLPWYVQHHPTIIGNYIRLPVADDVVEILHTVAKNMGESTFIKKFDRLPNVEKASFVRFCSGVQGKMSTLVKNFLRSLPMFYTTHSKSDHLDYASVSEVSRAAPAHSLPVTVKERLLDVSKKDHRTLARILGVTFLNVSTVFKQNIIPELNQSKLSQKQAEQLMAHVFSNIQSFLKEDPQFFTTLSDVSFVRTSKGLAKPSALFDPRVRLLRELFTGEDLFPTGVFVQDESLVLLRKMGLRDESGISAKDILYSIVACSDIDDQALQIKKGQAVLRYLDSHSDVLLQEVNGKLLLEWASELAWVPVLLERPEYFPASLPWCGKEPVAKPGQVTSETWTNELGSVKPVLLRKVSSSLSEKFDWHTPPQARLVVEQLQQITQNYTHAEKVKYLPLIIAVYARLKECAEVEDVPSALKTIKNWVWTGDGFNGISDVVVQKSFVDLQPFVLTLPKEVQPYSSLFTMCGMQEACEGDRLVGVLHQVKNMYDVHELRDDSLDPKRHLQLTIDILNHLQSIYDDLDDEVKTDILVPVQSEDESSLKLRPVEQCTYCDTEWIRQGYDHMRFDDQDGILLVHPNLPTRTAETFLVPTLMSRMLDAEELEITGFGQAEPLTGRLRGLLEDYTDGLSIPKELIQNADDAGATTVKLLYDERTNEDAMKFLIDENMKECQGPALWAYNNAMFSDADFDNITKLGAATKKNEVDKIGQFGLGFNSVYNITDVPSFISGQNIVIFDPHMVHLGKGIKDKTKPGIRIDTKRNKTLLKRLPDQFKPFEDVFGCQLNQRGFRGTLFRLPLRTKNQAMRSEISDLHYGRDQMLALVKLLIQSAHTLLLFTQNVRKVELYHLPHGKTPDEAALVFSTEKEVAKIMKELPASQSSIAPMPCLTDASGEAKKNEDIQKTCSILKAASEYVRLQQKARSGRQMTIPEVPMSSAVIKTTTVVTQDGHRMFGKPSNGKKASVIHWLVSLSVGQEKSLSMAKGVQKGLVPTAGIAVLLQKKKGGFLPHPLDNMDLKGQVFCYMPLPIYSGLPVHINGTFALQSSRRDLSQKTDDDIDSQKFAWNCALLEDAVMHAYVQSLKTLTQLCPAEEPSSLYKIWPVIEKTKEYYSPLVSSFYQAVPTLPSVPWLQQGPDITMLGDALFVREHIGSFPKVGKLVCETLQMCFEGKRALVIPENVLKSFNFAGQMSLVEQKLYDTRRFYTEVFFPNITLVQPESRNPLVQFALHHCTGDLLELLQTCKCIPASPDGSELKSPSELIDPTNPVSCVFLPEDGKFPHGDLFTEQMALEALSKLGMQRHRLPWEFLLERAQTLGNVFATSVDLGQKLLRTLLQLLEFQLPDTGKTFPGGVDEEIFQVTRSLQSTPFLQVMKKPKWFSLPWKGDEHQEDVLFAPNSLYQMKDKNLVSVTQEIVNETQLTYKVKRYLALTEKMVTVEQVLTQLSHALEVNPGKMTHEEYGSFQELMHCIYSDLQWRCSQEPGLQEQLAAAFGDKKCILVGHTLLPPREVAFHGPPDCAPYLWILPTHFGKRYSPLLAVLGVQEEFEPVRYVESLQKMQEVSQGEPLKEKQLNLSVRLLYHLNTAMKAKGLKPTQVQENYGTLFAPNARGVLMNATDLRYNDCNSKLSHATHPSVPHLLATSIGIRTMKQESVSQHARGIPFGQKENLTTSLKRVLQSYPCDHEILKELIQNADDAKATKIHFVKDPRKHSTKHLFAETWASLQGPALCVYNNSPFTEGDMEGIQRLGEGSKAHDPNKTGQYGIGFSSVYHLTDAPSLLTAGEGLPETLCVFDPHCRYVPDATQAEPGMRYEDTETLRLDFPNVFECYLGNLKDFELKNGTMFRFPLRDANMAKMSDISKNEISIETLQTMLRQLKEEASDILLFTNYLQEISISEIDPDTGTLKNTYTVQSKISEKDQAVRNEMAGHIREATNKLRDGDWNLEDIPLQSASSVLTIVDNYGDNERWLVTQTLGIQDAAAIPPSIKKAFQAGELALLPRGGTAGLLERKSLSKPTKKNGRVFCFLPLPLECDLPVSINGHFALGYENRRHLWTNTDDVGYKKEWNNFISEHVISRAYVNLLLATRMQYLDVGIADDKTEISCEREQLDIALETQQARFPVFSERKPEWDPLVRAVYKTIADADVPILPCVQQVEKDKSTHDKSAQTPRWEILWLPPSGKGAQKAFFKDEKKAEETPKEKSSSLFGKLRSWITPHSSSQSPEETADQILKKCLVGSGFKLLDASLEIAMNFGQAGVTVNHMSPEGVLAFYGTYSTDTPSCQIGDLPRPLIDTPFQNEKVLEIVLQYCKGDSDFYLKLEGLPLLLTADNVLRVFDCEQPVFISSYQDLVPSQTDLFLIRSMMHTVFEVDKCRSSEVLPFQEFNIKALAGVLDQSLEREQFYKRDQVEWSRGISAKPSRNWVQRLWRFVKEQLEEDDKKDQTETAQQSDAGSTDSDHETDRKCEDLKQRIEPLQDWCLVPTRMSGRCGLSSIASAEEVLSLSIINSKDVKITDALRKLNLRELDTFVLNTETSKTSDVVSMLTATLNKPRSILSIVHRAMGESPPAGKLSKKECSQLLEYFSENIKALEEEEEEEEVGDTTEKLLSLPFYATIYGDLIPLSGCAVYVLPSKIPTQGIEVWQSKSGTVFLEHDKKLEALYDFIGCASVDIKYVYCQFIFQHFEYFDAEDRLVHLHHVYNKYLKDGAKSDLSSADKQELLDTLRKLSFIEDASGDLQPASDFFDPENEVFNIMLPQDKFPPRPSAHFKESEWYTLMSQLGLQREVSKEMYLSFTRQVAEEGKLHRQSGAALTKSKVLTQHLFKMEALSRNDISVEIANVPFIAAEPASQPLRALYPQYGDLGDGQLQYTSFTESIPKEHEALVWSQASLLPSWADPMKLDMLHQGEKDDIMENLGIQKQPSVELVVSHLCNLCIQLETAKTPNQYTDAVFRRIYGYLQEHGLAEPVVKDRLKNTPCILVEQGKGLTRPGNVVVDMLEEDEIKPFLYRMPMEMGQFKQLFLYLGATDKASGEQYVTVLDSLHRRVGNSKMNPNELLTAYKAMRGILQKEEKKDSLTHMYWPSTKGRLLESTKLVHNDAPAYYERVKDYGIQFLVDVRECGLRRSDAEKMLLRLPEHVRPALLSSIVKETLMEDAQRNRAQDRVAKTLNERLKSEVFHAAIIRLMRHEAEKYGKKIDEQAMFDITDRLSTITVYSVDAVKTNLTFKGTPVVGSEVQKVCYVEKVQGAASHIEYWSVYINSNATLDQELLIPLAEKINSMLDGNLGESVLYLLPILSCNDDNIRTTLDSFQVRMDQLQATYQCPTLPIPGSEVPNELHKLLRPACRQLEHGEYVARKQEGDGEGDGGSFIYAIVREQVMGTSDHKVYLVNIGSESAVIAQDDVLYRFSRE